MSSNLVQNERSQAIGAMIKQGMSPGDVAHQYAITHGQDTSHWNQSGLTPAYISGGYQQYSSPASNMSYTSSQRAASNLLPVGISQDAANLIRQMGSGAQNAPSTSGGVSGAARQVLSNVSIGSSGTRSVNQVTKIGSNINRGTPSAGIVGSMTHAAVSPIARMGIGSAQQSVSSIERSAVASTRVGVPVPINVVSAQTNISSALTNSPIAPPARMNPSLSWLGLGGFSYGSPYSGNVSPASNAIRVALLGGQK